LPRYWFRYGLWWQLAAPANRTFMALISKSWLDFNQRPLEVNSFQSRGCLILFLASILGIL
jgi:hypothetical protein